MSKVDIRHFHLFCGLGGGARGFNRGQARVGSSEAVFRCIGGIDNDPVACQDFERLAAAPATVLDLLSREGYRNFHGSEPPMGWREATPDDLRLAAGNEFPNIVFSSPPCKGFSGLLSEGKSLSPKYQALNELVIRGVFLALEAWSDDPPELFIIENVPRVQTRGRQWLDLIDGMLRAYGYAVAETTHDCGELGGLAQHRKRFLMVARHREKVPPYLFEPPTQRVRGVGEVLGGLPMPEDPLGGPMHQLPRLQFMTWLRLAFVEAGKDWRSLESLRVVDGKLRDYRLLPDAQAFGGAWGVLDPRPGYTGEFGQFGVKKWDEPCNTVIGRQSSPAQGPYSVADPRPEGSPFQSHRNREPNGNRLRITQWDEPSGTILGKASAHDGAAIADPRIGSKGKRYNNVYRIVPWGEAAQAVTGGGTPTSGGQAVADPRPNLGNGWQNPTHFGVLDWNQPADAVTASGRHDNGKHSVADPRMPRPSEQVLAFIRSIDGTWHRPFSTLELAALQGLVDPDDLVPFAGSSHTGWRQRIGNAVPSKSAKAIASVMGTVILLARDGQTFALGATPIWVRPLTVALSVAQFGEVRP